MKKALLVLAIVCTMSLISGMNARADTWVTCDVLMFGQGWDQTYIRLTDAVGSSFTSRWFVANPSRGKELLATAMFAASNGKRVLVNVTSPNEYSTINAMYVVN